MDQSPQAAADPADDVVRAWDRPLLRVPVFVLIALVGGLLGSFTLGANLLVLAVGGTLMWIGITGRAGRRPALQRIPRDARWWLLPVLLFAGVELVAYSQNSIENYPTLSLLADPVLEHYPARVACYLGWLAVFWGLSRR